MNLSELTAISPIDGRYRKKIATLAPYFSEFALMRYRVLVEVEYFISLTQTGLKPLTALSDFQKHALRDLYVNFDEASALEIKKNRTDHQSRCKGSGVFHKGPIRVTRTERHVRICALWTHFSRH